MRFSHFIPVGLMAIALTFSACTIISTQTEVPDDVLPLEQYVPTIQLENMGALGLSFPGIVVQILRRVSQSSEV